MKKIEKIFLIAITHISLLSSGQSSIITGQLPGKENQKMYISYFLPEFSGYEHIDSCMTDATGNFEFSSPFKEPVLAYLSFKHSERFEFLTDWTTVQIRAIYPGKAFHITKIEAVSPTNIQYAGYKNFTRTERIYADSLYNIFDRLTIERKNDSLKVLMRVVKQADSAWRIKVLQYTKSGQIDPSLKSLLIYKRLMPWMPFEELKNLFSNLETEGQLSVYGKGINDFILSKNALKIGSNAPVLTDLLDPSGKKVLMSDFMGKYLLVNFWASWYPGSREGNSGIKRIHNKYGSKNFEILSISMDHKKQDWVNAVKKDQLPWRQVSDMKFWNSELVKLYGLFYLPFNVLIDPDGKIIAIKIQNRELEKKLEEIL